jgi:hypothetical protein
MKLNLCSILILFALGLCVASPALSASLTIQATGPGTFSIQGSDMDGVGGIDLTIGYDPAALSAPKVSWGSLVSGALSVANTSAPGVIRIAIIRTEPLSGSGPIAVLTFSTQSGSGGLSSFSAKLIDAKGGELPVQAAIAPEAIDSATTGLGMSSNPGVPFSQPDSSRTSTAAVSATVPQSVQQTATQATAGLGSVTMPGDGQAKNDKQPAETKSVQPPETQESPEAVTRQVKSPMEEKRAEPVEPVDAKQTQTIHGSVLDRFRTYQGEKTPEILIALFTKEVSPAFRQEPAIAVSDGTAVIRVKVDFSALKGTSTSFALSGAKMVSLKKEDDSNIWVLDTLPQANSLKATVSVMNGASIIEFPLTVVPPAVGVSSSRAEFAAFLKDSAAKAPKHDLNGDGRHDYLDDYIYTAHYLIKTGTIEKNTRKQ